MNLKHRNKLFYLLLLTFVSWFSKNPKISKNGLSDQFKKISISSGIYKGLGNLFLINNGKSILGYYHGERGNGFSTDFFLRSRKQSNDTIFVKITFADTILGVINGYLKSDSNRVFFYLDNTPPGDCFSLDGNYDYFSLQKSKYDFIGLGFFKEDTVEIYDNYKKRSGRIKNEIKNKTFLVLEDNKTKIIKIGLINFEDSIILDTLFVLKNDIIFVE